MKRRAVLFSALVGSFGFLKLASLLKDDKGLKISFSDFGSVKGGDHTAFLKKAEQEAFSKGQTLTLPKRARLIISEPISFRISVIGNGATIEAAGSKAKILVENFKGKHIYLKGIKLLNFLNGSSAIEVSDSQHVLIAECRFQNCTGKAIGIKNSHYISMNSNKIHGTLETGILALNSNSIKIQNNSIKFEGSLNDKVERHFVWLENSFNSQVSSNNCLSVKRNALGNAPTIGVLNGFGDPLVNIFNNKINA